MLERGADSLEADLPRLLGLLAREAGKTYPNGIAEVREAVDFLRFYAAQARRDLGGGDVVPLGPIVCISRGASLAIFAGQVAAALAAGNPVLAKPAEQTPLLPPMVQRLHQRRHAGRRCSCCPAQRNGRRRARRRRASRRHVHRLDRRRAPAAEEPSRAERRRPRRALIAETGGQNAMLVDSSALAEQVVPTSSPRRSTAPASCSALHVLCLQATRRPHRRDAEGRDGREPRRDRGPRRRRRPGDRRRRAPRSRPASRRCARAAAAYSRSPATTPARPREHLRVPT
jgi:RHH-type proline utilization regulon transcriptional repressor/proline dehydrogenase/delta 1-pyrroline-5-carboxylate dehydrogenase